MNTLQQEQNEPKFAVNQIEDKVSGNSLRAWLKWNDEQQRKAIATARAEGAAEERKKILTKIASCFPVEKEGDIGLFVVEHTGKLVPTMPFNDYEALTTKEHHAE